MSYIKPTGTPGSGDMVKSVYDANNDGKVTSAAAADTVPWSGVGNPPATYAPSTHTHTPTEAGLGNVDNTTDVGKPISTATQTALDLKSPITSPTFLGTPAAPAPAAGTNTIQLATTAYARAAAPNASYRLLAAAMGSHVATKIAGTYILGCGDPLAVSGTGVLYPRVLIPYYAADYPAVNGLTTKLRVQAIVTVNNTAPTGNFTVGLYPVTSGAGGAALKIITVGSLVTNSACTTVTTPAGSSIARVVSADFTPPADGIYCLAVVTTQTVATSSLVWVEAQLQMRNN